MKLYLNGKLVSKTNSDTEIVAQHKILTSLLENSIVLSLSNKSQFTNAEILPNITKLGAGYLKDKNVMLSSFLNAYMASIILITACISIKMIYSLFKNILQYRFIHYAKRLFKDPSPPPPPSPRAILLITYIFNKVVEVAIRVINSNLITTIKYGSIKCYLIVTYLAIGVYWVTRWVGIISWHIIKIVFWPLKFNQEIILTLKNSPVTEDTPTADDLCPFPLFRSKPDRYPNSLKAAKIVLMAQIILYALGTFTLILR